MARHRLGATRKEDPTWGGEPATTLPYHNSPAPQSSQRPWENGSCHASEMPPKGQLDGSRRANSRVVAQGWRGVHHPLHTAETVELAELANSTPTSNRTLGDVAPASAPSSACQHARDPEVKDGSLDHYGPGPRNVLERSYLSLDLPQTRAAPGPCTAGSSSLLK